MWDRLAGLAKTLFTISEDLKQNRQDIKELRQDLQQLTIVVQRLAADVEHTKDREANEREKLILQLKNTLLQFERHINGRLPPPKD